MSLQLNYSDPVTGIPYPSSLWVWQSFNTVMLDQVNQIAQTVVVYAGYFDQATMLAGNSPFMIQTFVLPSGPINTSATIEQGISQFDAFAQAQIPFFATAVPVAAQQQAQQVKA